MHQPPPPMDDDIRAFDAMYARAAGDAEVIPWSHRAPHPLLIGWLDEAPGVSPIGSGRALVIASGLGDDAEELARRGWQTTAFDGSPTAISWAQRRYPASAVDYHVADLFALPRSWRYGFDLVLENRTIQSLPPERHPAAVAAIAATVAPGGLLVAIAHGRDETEPAEHRPWPLARSELDAFAALGLVEQSFTDTWREHADGSGRRPRLFRAVYRRPAPAAESSLGGTT